MAMTEKEGARRAWLRGRAASKDDKDIIAEAFGVASAWAGVIFVVSFGAMMLVAAWMGW